MLLCHFVPSSELQDHGPGRDLTRKHFDEPYKKKFTIIYARVSGVSKLIAQKIEELVNYPKDDLMEQLSGDDQAVDSFTFSVSYNKNGILIVHTNVETSVAYPDNTLKTIDIDLKTGEEIGPKSAFQHTSQLIRLCLRAQRREVLMAKKDLRFATCPS